MAKPGQLKRTAEYKEWLNKDYSPTNRVNVTISGKTYAGTVEGLWSNFGLSVLLDGNSRTTIVNLLNDKVTKINN